MWWVEWCEQCACVKMHQGDGRLCLVAVSLPKKQTAARHQCFCLIGYQRLILHVWMFQCAGCSCKISSVNFHISSRVLYLVLVAGMIALQSLLALINPHRPAPPVLIDKTAMARNSFVTPPTYTPGSHRIKFHNSSLSLTANIKDLNNHNYKPLSKP